MAVSVDDNEAAPHFTVSPGSVTVVEGGSDDQKKKEITLRIASSAANHPPTASVVVNATSGDTSAVTVSRSSQTYTTGNYATLQTFTVTAVDDDGRGGRERDGHLHRGLFEFGAGIQRGHGHDDGVGDGERTRRT